MQYPQLNIVSHRRAKLGFTIVELLIVIVVIAILAAISIVAYTGIQDRARATAATSAARQVADKIAVYAVENDGYPASLSDIGFSDANGTSYQYRVNNGVTPATWCVTATAGNKSYYTSDAQGAPREGACAGHGSAGVAAITNLVRNPSAELNQDGFGGANGATVARTTTSAIFGSFGMSVSTPTGGSVDSGVGLPFPTALTAGQQITYSVSIRAITAGTYRLALQSSAGNKSQSITLGANQVGRITMNYTPSFGGTLAAYVLRTTTTASTFHVDGVMSVEGDRTAGFADGESSDWVWNGTPNNSTSTGPPL